MIKVLKTNFRLLALLINLKTLAILNALIMVVAPPIEKLDASDKIMLIYEPITMAKSK